MILNLKTLRRRFNHKQVLVLATVNSFAVAWEVSTQKSRSRPRDLNTYAKSASLNYKVIHMLQENEQRLRQVIENYFRSSQSIRSRPRGLNTDAKFSSSDYRVIHRLPKIEQCLRAGDWELLSQLKIWRCLTQSVPEHKIPPIVCGPSGAWKQISLCRPVALGSSLSLIQSTLQSLHYCYPLWSQKGGALFTLRRRWNYPLKQGSRTVWFFPCSRNRARELEGGLQWEQGGSLLIYGIWNL